MSALQVFYDGQCPLCSREIDHYRKQERASRIAFVDISSAHFEPIEFPAEDFHKVFHVRGADGQWHKGVQGFVAIWKELEIFSPLIWLAERQPFQMLFQWGYGVFARIRPFLTRSKCEDQCQI